MIGAASLGGKRWMCLRGRAARCADRARELHLQYHLVVVDLLGYGLTVEEVADAMAAMFPRRRTEETTP